MFRTLLSVLLVSMPAATGNNSKSSRLGGNLTRSSSRLSLFPASQALFLSDVRQEWPPHAAVPAVCGEQETNCAAQGHPEICCPANTACHLSSHKQPSPIFCCPFSSHACSSSPLPLPLSCPAHTFPCPPSLSGACCPIGLRCASSLCLEYAYKTQAIFSASPPTTTEPNPLDTSLSTLPATIIPAHTVVPQGNPLSEATGPTCVPPNPNCQPGTPGTQATDLPISDRILGTPTAWRAKIGEVVAVESRANGGDCGGGGGGGGRKGCFWRGGGDGDGMDRGWWRWWGRRKKRRAVWSGVGLFGVTGVMLAL